MDESHADAPGAPTGPNAAVALIAALIAAAVLASALTAPVSMQPARPVEDERLETVQAHLEALEFDAARALLDTVLSSSPSARAHELSATLREAGSDVTGALLDVGRAIDLDPRRPTAYALRAALLIAREQRHAALADLVRAIELGVYASTAPHPAAAVERSLATTGPEQRALGDAHARRADELLATGDAQGAQAAFDRAFERDALATHAYGAARAALARGDRDAAFERLERAYAEGLRDWRRIRTDERLAALRPDPRFQALLTKMGAQ